MLESQACKIGRSCDKSDRLWHLHISSVCSLCSSNGKSGTYRYSKFQITYFLWVLLICHEFKVGRFQQNGCLDSSPVRRMAKCLSRTWFRYKEEGLLNTCLASRGDCSCLSRVIALRIFQTTHIINSHTRSAHALLQIKCTVFPRSDAALE